MKNKTQENKKPAFETTNHSDKQKNHQQAAQEVKPSETGLFINKRYSFNGNANGYQGL